MSRQQRRLRDDGRALCRGDLCGAAARGGEQLHPVAEAPEAELETWRELKTDRRKTDTEGIPSDTRCPVLVLDGFVDMLYMFMSNCTV